MKKEFITPMIETEMLTARDRVMGIYADSDENAGGTEGMSSTKDSAATRAGEDDHWYGIGR